MQWEIGIDLGSYGVRMAQRESGVLLQEHSEMAYYEGERQPFSWGDDAYDLKGRVPSYVQVRRPVANGVLDDSETARFWIKTMHKTADSVRKNRRGTILMSCVPGSRTAHEEALMHAALECGAVEAGIVRSDACAALGAGLDIMAPGASCIVEIGAGHVSASVWTLGHVAVSASLPYGLSRIDERIRKKLIYDHAFSAGPLTVESIRKQLGAAGDEVLSDSVTVTACGLDLRERFVKEEELCPSDVYPAVSALMDDIVAMLEEMIAHIPEELSADLIDNGIVLAGGGAHIPGAEVVIGSALDLPCRVCSEPENAVVRGLHEVLRRSIYYERLVNDRMARAGQSA